MIALTTPIAVPNVTRLRVVRVELDDVNEVAIVTVEARSPVVTNRVYGSYRVHLANGDGSAAKKSQRLVLNAAAATYGDSILVESTFELVNGFTNVEAAYRGAANRAAANRAVETQGLTDGWIAAALTGVVS